MDEIIFEWDEIKHKSNLEKHGVDFFQAKAVFDDENKIETPDNRNEYGEQRFKIVGTSIDLVLSVIYTMRGAAVRIISARAASKRERVDYNKYL